MSAISDKLLLNAAPWLASRMIRLIYRFLKTEYLGLENTHKLWNRDENVILSFWHDQLFLMVAGYDGPGAKVMISSSKDGELIARTMSYFGVGTVRGSSTRGGKAAFREMLALANEKIDLVFTPDGPKGPRHEVKEGVVQLARLTKRPVVPMAFVCSHGHRFASWDRFLLPFPLGRGVFSFGEPVYYDKSESLEDFRSAVQKAMEKNTAKAAEHLNRYDLPAL